MADRRGDAQAAEEARHRVFGGAVEGLGGDGEEAA